MIFHESSIARQIEASKEGNNVVHWIFTNPHWKLVDDLFKAQTTVTEKIKIFIESFKPVEVNSNGNYVSEFLNQDSPIRPAKKSNTKQKDSGEESDEEDSVNQAS